MNRNFISSIPFDKEKWNADDYGDRVKVRPGMARKLVADKSLIGKNRAEIIEMLGEEDTYEDLPSIKIYNLEDIYRENIDPIAIEYLKITFDSENRVEKAEIEFHKTGDW